MRCVILLLVACLSGCGHRYSNVKTFPINSDICKEFVVIELREDQEGQYPIGYVDRDNRLQMIRAPLDTLGQIRQVMPSPDRSKVLIVSYGEGHQYVSVYEVNELQRELRYENDGEPEPLKALTTLDPYPNGLDNIRWLDNGRIEFEGISDYADFDRGSRRGAYNDDMDQSALRKWVWTISDDTFVVRTH